VRVLFGHKKTEAMEGKGSSSIFSIFENIGITDKEFEEIGVEAQDWMLCHGVLMRTKGKGLLTHAPFTLLPCPYPRTLFKTAWNLSPLFNLLVHETSQDEEFIEEALKM
jgi:glutathione synthase